MYSLFNVLTSQHGDEFAPVKCNAQTVTRLIGYFEDVVTEHQLSALVVEGRCLDGDPVRSAERAAKTTASSKHLFILSCDQKCARRTWCPEPAPNLTLFEQADFHSIESGPFVLVMESRFAGLLASCEVETEESNHAKTYEMIWTFDPNVVFTAIEYLMARISTHSPAERLRLEGLLNQCTPRSSLLKMALTFTHKLTMLMQRQNELEIATNRISSAISSTLEMEQILQPAVTEVGRALKARHAAIVLWDEMSGPSGRPETMEVYDRGEAGTNPSTAHGDVDAVRDGTPPAPLKVSITHRQSVIGELHVEDDTPERNWEPEELLMARIVSDQLAVAISHARLFKQVQTQAITDALTGLNNRRYFQERLERETKLADRNNHSVSLILLDVDRLKLINDTHGHRSGDAALKHVAKTMVATVREVDVCARYGGEEFVIILPQCSGEDAIDVAERLREAIASNPVPRIGQVTASVGVASYPGAARNKDELIEQADRAMYFAKAAGRNRVRTLMHRTYANFTTSPSPIDEPHVVE
jgi:diguanylate cyclase (GGDEF)-like protein